MAADYFLKLTDIKGEAKDSKHKDEIEVLSFSWGASQAGGAAYGGGAGTGKASFQDFHFVMRMNKASPALLTALATGKAIKQADLTARKAGEGQQEYYKIKFENLIVSSYQSGASTGGDDVPMEQISLNYSKYEVSYQEQKLDGKLDTAVVSSYDLKAQTK